MEKPTACLKCGGALPSRPATGRPPNYCSPTCRRLAEFAIRRVNRRLQRLEEEASRLRHGPDIGIRDWRGRTQQEVLADLAGEIADAEVRLRALLAEPRGKSPECTDDE